MSERKHSPLLRALAVVVGAYVAVLALPGSWVPDWLPSFLSVPDFHLGLDLQGGTQLDYQISEREMEEQVQQLSQEVEVLKSQDGDPEKIQEKEGQIATIQELRGSIVEALRTVLERRINSLGVSEAVITPAYFGAEKHLLVECPGVIDIQRCIETVGKTILLEFKEEFRGEDTVHTERVKRRAEETLGAITASGKSLAEISRELEGSLGVAAVERPLFRDELPEGLEVLWSTLTGQVLKLEGALWSAPPAGEQGPPRKNRGVFLAEVLGPKQSTGRTISGIPAVLGAVSRSDPSVILSRREGVAPSSLDAATRVLLLRLEPQGFTGALTKKEGRILYLESRTEGQETVKANHILLAYGGGQGAAPTVTRTKEEALALARDLRSRLTQGADFAALAKQYSDDQGSQGKGGALGSFGRGAMVYAFERAAFSLSEGQISEPIETPFGYHLIQSARAPQREEGALTFAELRVTGREREERFRRFLADLAAGSISRPEDRVPVRLLFLSYEPTGWRDTALDGKHFRRAIVTSDSFTGLPIVQITFGEDGGRMFQQLTRDNVGKRIAIFVGGQLVSAPTVQSEIPGGTAIITGVGTFEEGSRLAQDLNTGAIPAPVHLVGQATVGPTLGAAALRDSLRAGVVGFVLLSIFMVWYYRVLGVLAVVALVVYSAIFIAFLKLPVFLVTDQYIVLTLAGIAGVLMTVGMALDANVLIFERIKEELCKGKLLHTAVEVGFRRAWSAIWDSNVSTFITAFILFVVGTSIVRGFAVTLAFGIPLSMFTAIVVTRWLIRYIETTPVAGNLEAFGVKGTSTPQR